MTRIFALIIIAIAAVTVGSPLVAQTDTVFTYQGDLKENGGIANGLFDFEIVLRDALEGGNLVGPPIVINDMQVTDGRFAVELDFGAAAFGNTSRWIEIAVNGSELSPRQPVTRAPYSIQTRGIFVDANDNVGIGTSTPFTHCMLSQTAKVQSSATAKARPGAASSAWRPPAPAAPTVGILGVSAHPGAASMAKPTPAPASLMACSV